jgi:hypothetical protein
MKYFYAPQSSLVKPATAKSSVGKEGKERKEVTLSVNRSQLFSGNSIPLHTLIRNNDR